MSAMKPTILFQNTTVGIERNPKTGKLMGVICQEAGDASIRWPITEDSDFAKAVSDLALYIETKKGTRH